LRRWSELLADAAAARARRGCRRRRVQPSHRGRVIKENQHVGAAVAGDRLEERIGGALVGQDREADVAGEVARGLDADLEFVHRRDVAGDRRDVDQHARQLARHALAEDPLAELLQASDADLPGHLDPDEARAVAHHRREFIGIHRAATSLPTPQAGTTSRPRARCPGSRQRRRAFPETTRCRCDSHGSTHRY
jgi:hypothetical protein